ncbi:MAG TPA: signal peptidase I [Acidimicrobiia bacterium]|jgi:signal peptidase I|nr:signal peptidase I [Acidimicrobiia bacterium]
MRSPVVRRFGLTQVGTFAGWVVISYLATMLLWVVVPSLVLGWRPMVVVSGSMSPLIRAGDVVHIDPGVVPDTPGAVVGFDVGDGVTIHRLHQIAGDGSLITKGDANSRPDSTPVAPEQVIGQARLLVPYIGMAKVWGWWWWWAGLLLVLLLVAPTWRNGLGRTAVVAAVVMVAAGSVGALALFRADTAAGGALRTLTVHPPTTVSATCPIGLVGPSIPVTITWQPSATSGVTGYRILYDPPGGGSDFSEIGTVNATTFLLEHELPGTLLSLGRSHRYAVVTQRDAWASGYSAIQTVTTTQLLGLVYLCGSD